MSDRQLIRQLARNTRNNPRAIILLAIGLLLIGPTLTLHAQNSLTQADLLRRAIDLDRLTLPPTGETPERSAGNIEKEPADPDNWHILASLRGPGVITRTWIPSHTGRLRIVIDGEPIIDADLAQWHAGTVEPVQAPLIDRSGNCYFPFGFAQSALILAQSAAGPFQVDHVRLPPGTTVQPSASQLDEAAQAAREDVLRVLTMGLGNKQLFGQRRRMPVAQQQDLKPGETLCETLDFPGTIRAFYVAQTDHGEPGDPYPLHRCRLRFWFDDAKDPQIDVPLIDFFGCGFDVTPANSLIAGTDLPLPVPLPDRHSGRDRFMYGYLPMPFHQGVRIEIENLNRGRKPLGLLLYLEVEPQAPPADALHLHAGFRCYYPAPTEQLTLFKSRSTARIVGWVLSVDCPQPGWWTSASQQLALPSTAIAQNPDQAAHCFGQTTPLRHLVDPLAGVTRAGPFSKSSAYRWLLSDAPATTAGLHWTIDNQPPAGAGDVYLASLVYWYGDPAARGSFPSLEREDFRVPGLRIPGSVEIEDHVLGRDWGSVIRQQHAGDVELSGQLAIHFATSEPVSVVIPSDRDRRVKLLLRANPRRPFETITVKDSAGRQIATINYDRRPAGIYPVGTLELNAGNNTVTIQCTKPAMLDCWIIEDAKDTGESAAQTLRPAATP